MLYGNIPWAHRFSTRYTSRNFFLEAFKRIIPKLSLRVDIEFQPERVPATPGRQLRFLITALHSFWGLGMEFS